MKKYILTEEWYEEDIKERGRCESTVYAFGYRTEREIKQFVEDMNKYSPFDYVDYQTFNDEKSYRDMLKTLENNGSKINYENDI